MFSFSCSTEPISYERAQAARKEEREFQKQMRENYKIANQLGYENLTNLRGAYRRKKNGM